MTHSVSKGSDEVWTTGINPCSATPCGFVRDNAASAGNIAKTELNANYIFVKKLNL